MIQARLYNVLPSDTWAFAYAVPWFGNVTGLMAGYSTRELAQGGALYLSQKLELELELEYVA